MKKEELLNYIDNELLEKLYGFCYARTEDSVHAGELCSDIVFELVKTANSQGEIGEVYPFIWRVARNVYADYSKTRKKRGELFYQGDPEELFSHLTEEEERAGERGEMLHRIYQRIAFLTRAYREVMIAFYLDGLSVSKIAAMQHTEEGTVRQRLFSARKKLKSEVENMTNTYEKPVALNKIEYTIIGTGSPAWGDPREGFERQLSKQIVWLCRKGAKTPSEIAKELNVPTMYVEEEMEILVRGSNGKYGLLKKTENGRYVINFVLLEKRAMEEANALYVGHLPAVANVICKFVEENKEEYLSFPYLNRRVDLNLILWQQFFDIANCFTRQVEKVLKTEYFASIPPTGREFSVFGHEDNGKYWGCGQDGVNAQNICGYSHVHLCNTYISRIKAHFHCGKNVSLDKQLQLTIRAIDGLSLKDLSESEQEHAAKAVECGYLFREGDMLYTKILVHDEKDNDRLFDISERLSDGYFDETVQKTAAAVAELIRKEVPAHLQGDWRFANLLAGLPMFDLLAEELIGRGLLTPPENGVGAEGCWMGVWK